MNPKEPPIEAMETTSQPPKPKRQKPKGNNSAARRQDKFRERVGSKVLEDYRKSQNQKHLGNMAALNLFSQPEGLSLANPTPVMLRTPVSTFGVSLAVNELWTRFKDQFYDRCSIYQLFRFSLAQFEYQRYVASQQATSFYPYDHGIDFNFDAGFRNVLRAHPDNFEALTLIIDSIGYVKLGDAVFVPSVPVDKAISPPDKVHLCFTSLKDSVRKWSTTASDWEFNPLPGAIVDPATNLLLNPQDYWPTEYGPDQLRSDAIAVMKVLENMRAKFERVSNKCTFDGVGKPSMLVSVSDPTLSIPPIEPSRPTVSVAKPGKRKRFDTDFAELAISVTSASVDECTWYTSYPLDSQMMHLGAYTMVGLTFEDLERRCPATRVRNRYNSIRRLTDSWMTLFDWLTPKVSRN